MLNVLVQEGFSSVQYILYDHSRASVIQTYIYKTAQLTRVILTYFTHW